MDDEKVGSVVKADPATRYIFFFSNKSLTDSNYCFNPFGTDEYHPFYVVDHARSAYVCVYQDRNSKDVQSDLVFNIVISKYQGGNKEQKIKKVKNDDAFPKQNAQTLTWCIPGNRWVSFVDFENYSKYAYAKQKHYEGIAKSIMESSLNLIGETLAPLAVFRIIFSSWAYLTSKERLLLKRQIARNVFSTELKLCLTKVGAVKSWKEMSTLLVCLTSLWLFETQSKQNQFIGCKEMAEIYSNLISLKCGSTNELLENVRHCFGEHNAYLMNKLTSKILEERTLTCKYGYCIWYNLFHCVNADPKSQNKEKIQNELKNMHANSTMIDDLLTFVDYDLTFLGHNRAIQLEYDFVRCLLDPSRNASYALKSTVKYDFIKEILMKLPQSDGSNLLNAYKKEPIIEKIISEKAQESVEDRLRTELNTAIEESKSALNKVQLLKMENEKLKQGVAAKDEEVQTLKANVDQLRSDNAKLENSNKLQLEQKQQYEAQIKALEEEIESMRNMNAESEQKNDEHAQHRDLERILQNWGLGQYRNVLIDEYGFDEITDWRDITENILRNDMNFKLGHAWKFIRKTKEYFNLKDEQDQNEGAENEHATAFV